MTGTATVFAGITPRFLLAGLLFSLTLAMAQPARAALGPFSALDMAQQSIDDNNSTKFTRAVDIDSILRRALPQVGELLRAEAARSNNTDNNLMLLLGMMQSMDRESMENMLLPVLGSELKGFVAYGINGGYFSGRRAKTGGAVGGTLASALDKLPEGRRELVPGDIKLLKGDSAQVTATLLDPGAGAIPLLLNLEKQGSDWRVVEVVNARELFDSFTKNKKK
ncbi:hypothetical protein LJC59_09485 [Desulfovibrio sp. OttesenSCG-928-A18]|nr:hypothetical protein [Desulfovibrio sp. OttesenSCG-928-A18]